MGKMAAADGGGKKQAQGHSFAVLQKKLEKVDHMLEQIASQRGGVKSKEYKKLYRKREEYQLQIEQTDEFKQLQAELMGDDDDEYDDDEWEDKLKSPAAMKSSVAAARTARAQEDDDGHEDDGAYESRNLDNSPAPLGMNGGGKKLAIPTAAGGAPPYKDDDDDEDEDGEDDQSYDEVTVDTYDSEDRSYDEVSADSKDEQNKDPIVQGEGEDSRQVEEDEDEGDEDVEVQRIQQAIEILYDKVDKVDHLLQEIVQERGDEARDDDDFIQLSAKREEYVAALEEAEEWLDDYYNGDGEGEEVDEEDGRDTTEDEEEDDMDMFDAAGVARKQLEDEEADALAEDDQLDSMEREKELDDKQESEAESSDDDKAGTASSQDDDDSGDSSSSSSSDNDSDDDDAKLLQQAMIQSPEKKAAPKLNYKQRQALSRMKEQQAKDAEVLRQKEEEEKKIQEAKRKEEEAIAEAKRKEEEEQRRREEEARCKEEEEKRQREEEARRKEEEGKAAAGPAKKRTSAKGYSYDVLRKKLEKVEDMLDGIIESKGYDAAYEDKKFQQLETKRNDYLAQLEEMPEWKQEQEAGQNSQLLQEEGSMADLNHGKPNKDEAQGSSSYMSSSYLSYSQISSSNLNPNDKIITGGGGGPRSYNVLKPKLDKVVRLLKEIEDEKGEDEAKHDKKYQQLEKKREQYSKLIEETPYYKLMQQQARHAQLENRKKNETKEDKEKRLAALRAKAKERFEAQKRAKAGEADDDDDDEEEDSPASPSPPAPSPSSPSKRSESFNNSSKQIPVVKKDHGDSVGSLHHHSEDILRKKLAKVENMLEGIVQKKGLAKAQADATFLKLEKKKLEYTEALQEYEVVEADHNADGSTDENDGLAVHSDSAKPTHSYKVLKKKISKIEELMEEALESQGEDSKEYRKLSKKRDGYQESLELTDEWKAMNS